MKKSINRKVYNTETATLVKSQVYSYFGDPAGYEENLYKTARGDYFVHGIGGPESKYPEEDIIAVSDEDAAKF